MPKEIRRIGSSSRPQPVDTGVIPFLAEQESMGLRSRPDEYVSDRNESLDAALKLERDIQHLKVNIINFMSKYIDEKSGSFLYNANIIIEKKERGRIDL